MKIQLTPQAAADLTFQTYGPQPEIQGIWLHPLKKHVALEGWFMELFRLGAPSGPASDPARRGSIPAASASGGGAVAGLPAPFELRQISLSQAAPGRVNAFHLHPKEVQDELWCVVAGAMKVWLVDVREGSPTAGRRRPFLLTAGAPAVLHIPTGVAHGYQAGPAGALLVYAMNSQFNPADPNEGRLPWDYFGAELWEADRG